MRNNKELKGEIERHDQAKLTGMELTNVDPTSAAKRDHSVEHALPKYARAIPGVVVFAEQQSIGGPQGALAGSEWGEDHGLQRSLVGALLGALNYARSYGGKFMSHPLKAFYKAHRAAVDEAIVQLGQAETDEMVPNFAVLAITPVLPALAQVYTTAARKKLKVSDDAQLEEQKKQLDPNNAPVVTLAGRLKRGDEDNDAKQNDYLRDLSMLNTAKEAQGSGAGIFVIGDAHRKKLERTLKAAGMEVSNDEAWLNHQKELNIDAAQGLSAGQREGVDRVISSAKDNIAKTNLENNARRFEVGHSFKLPQLPHSYRWESDGADASANTRRFTVNTDAKPFNLYIVLKRAPARRHFVMKLG